MEENGENQIKFLDEIYNKKYKPILENIYNISKSQVNNLKKSNEKNINNEIEFKDRDKIFKDIILLNSNHYNDDESFISDISYNYERKSIFKPIDKK